jgi:hypothetical protein
MPWLHCGHRTQTGGPIGPASGHSPAPACMRRCCSDLVITSTASKTATTTLEAAAANGKLPLEKNDRAAQPSLISCGADANPASQRAHHCEGNCGSIASHAACPLSDQSGPSQGYFRRCVPEADIASILAETAVSCSLVTTSGVACPYNGSGRCPPTWRRIATRAPPRRRSLWSAAIAACAPAAGCRCRT